VSVDTDNPGRGDVTGMLQAAAERSRKATAMRDAEREVATAVATATPDVWAGQARSSFIAAAECLAVELCGLADRWEAEAAALNAYARGVQEIKDAQRLLEARREAAHEELDSLDWRWAAARSDLLVAVASEREEPQAQIRALERSIDDVRAGLTALQGEWDALVQQRHRVNDACIAALSGTSVLGALALVTRSRNADAFLRDLSAAEVLVLVRTDPGFAAQLARTAPAEVAPWWRGLSVTDRAALVAALPEVIGNLEGVSYRDRDSANRLWLAGQLADARAALEAAEEPAGFWELLTNGEGAGFREATSLAVARERVESLEAIQLALRASSGGDRRYLVSLTSDNPPLAAVSVGDLDTADVVSWAVPGMGSSAMGLPDWAYTAERIVQAQDDVNPGASHAVVAWVGYEAPGLGAPTVLDTALASAGAHNLERALVGFNATRENAMLNVSSHSYGTTTSAFALTRPDVQVDVVVNLGSAGLPADIDHASDLHADEVYAGQARDVWAIDPAPGDQWAWFGRDFSNHPVNPVEEGFGADVFGVDSGTGGSSVTDHGTSTPGGTGYLDDNTESLRNVALATTGQGAHTSSAIEHEPTPFQEAMTGGMRGAH